MRTRTTTVGMLAIAALTLTACGGHGDNKGASGSGTTATQESAKPKDASADFAVIHAAIPTTSLTVTVTAANDGNHLLGRPHQYTSAVKFADRRIKASDIDGLDKGDVTRGGGIEVFANHDDAQARADYIQRVTKSMPALTEYDYVAGDVVVRVSHLLTPDQAAAYKQAAEKLG